ncbi:MAG: SNF2-related protein [Promethearchaeota archaeon]
MVVKVNFFNYNCPFCGKELESRYSKCFNLYCQGQKFNIDNLVIYRLNITLGIGRIIKKINIPASKSLDKNDDHFITKYKVIFKDNLVKILHPIDLIHKIFKINDRIITKKKIGRINSESFLIRNGIISYEVLFPNGRLEQIEESQIEIFKYGTTAKRLTLIKNVDPVENFLIKYWATLFYSYYTSYQIKCITNSRLSLMAHQINVAHRLSEEHFPRIILADEVGLGKTIEAGIYIKEMMARNLVERVLIIVPASLVKQWQFEMRNKFNISFEIYDGKKIKELKQKGNYKISELVKNPFYYENLIICSLQFARNEKYIELLSQISWDIVIFDEAHHLRRYLINATTGNFRETLNYKLARILSENVEAMLLLTATPLQLHSFELYSLIELIHPEAFENFSDFEHFRKNMPFINLLIKNVSQIDKLNTFEIKNTIKLLKDLKYIDKNKNNEEVLKLLKVNSFKKEFLKEIEKDHTLSQFIIRNRKKNVFSEDLLNRRIVKTIMVNPTKQELDLYNEIRLYLANIYNSSFNKKNLGVGFVLTTLQKLLTSSKFAIMKSLQHRLEKINRFKNIFLEFNVIKEIDPEYYEIELEDEYIDSEIDLSLNNLILQESDDRTLDLLNQEKILKEFYNKLKDLVYDSKLEKLIEFLKQIYNNNPTEKVIIFTQFVDTLFYLKDELTIQGQDYLVEIFYGGLNKNEKDAAIEKFRANEKFAVLISTEIGGEGRNFQFCRILINYDLPWNPMKLEQRIGRIDRIGQESKEIYTYNFFIEGTIETDIVYALLNRINLFEKSIGVLEPIIGKIEKDLITDLVFSPSPGIKRKKLNEFIRSIDEAIQKAKEMAFQLEDLLIDKKSFQMNGLFTLLDSCQDVKLNNNGLFLFTNYFFNLNNHKYGYIENLKENEKKGYISEIFINDFLLNDSNYKLLENYRGTFNLELARNKEEIDFFALGHPLIDFIIDYCRNPSLPGTFTIINLKKKALPKKLFSIVNIHDELYLFVFTIKFQGYIIENQISTIIMDEFGMEIENLADFILDIINYDKIFHFKDYFKQKININKNLIYDIANKAKNFVKRKTSRWKKEIKQLNDKIFNLELKKKEKIYAHKRNVLNFKLISLKQKLERKKNKRPTERQKQNINNLKDETKRKEKLDKIEKLEEEIRFIAKDLEIIEKKLDDLSFEQEDLKNDIIKRNLRKFYTNIMSFAIIKLDN